MFKNQQETVSNTTASNKGQGLFGNCELFEELDDVDLMGISGGVQVNLQTAPYGIGDILPNGKVNLNGQISLASF